MVCVVTGEDSHSPHVHPREPGQRGILYPTPYTHRYLTWTVRTQCGQRSPTLPLPPDPHDPFLDSGTPYTPSSAQAGAQSTLNPTT
jgi:hypothetical protein